MELIIYDAGTALDGSLFISINDNKYDAVLQNS
jgi:hypothetical protein